MELNFQASDQLHQLRGTNGSFAGYVKLLQQCGDSKELAAGKKLHSQVMKSGMDRETYIGNLIIRMYGKCGSLADAQEAFERIRWPDAVSWNSIMGVYVRNGELDSARQIFDSIPEKSIVSWNAMIAAYAQSGEMMEARGLFESAPKRDVATWNAVLTGYSQNRLLSDAELIFRQMPQRNVVSWNAMIAAYDRNGRHCEALEVFRSMNVRPNDVTFVTVLDACVNISSSSCSPRGLAEGRHVYAKISSSGLMSEIKVCNALITMFAKCGSLADAKEVFEIMPRRNVRSSNIMIFALGSYGFLDEARKIFDAMSERSLISWNALITSYAQAGEGREALEIFKLMTKSDNNSNRQLIAPDEITFIALAEACGGLGRYEKCKEIHTAAAARGFELDTHVANALISMYGRCGQPDDARLVFDRLLLRNVVSWTSVISSYTQNRRAADAFRVFQLMDLDGVSPNPVTLANVIDACSRLANFQISRLVDIEARELGFAADVVVGSALVHMHGKCGNLVSCWNAFRRIEIRNLVSWTAMIAALAENGLGSASLDLFRVLQLQGFEPDAICLTGVLSACKHAGDLESGMEFFRAMTGDFGMAAAPGHFMCLIDLLGRCGRLDLAEELIDCMPFEPQVWNWTSLLGACKDHRDGGRGARAAQEALGLDPRRPAAYVMLAKSICEEG